MTGTLVQKAMLVDLRISQITKTRTDAGASRKTTQDNQAEEKAGKFIKNLFHPSSMAEINTLIGQVRTTHESLTRPWGRDGVRILATAAFTEYTTRIRGLIAQIEKAAQDFADKYPEALEKAKSAEHLGGLFKADDYPTQEQVRESFNVKILFFPIPTAGDFRVEIGAEDVEAIRAEIERETAETMRNAMKGLYEELYEAIGDLSMKIYQGGVSKASVEAMLNRIDRASKQNVAGDAEFDQTIAELRECFDVDAKDLREDAMYADQVVDKADELAVKMSEYFM
jgi:hypothetical protein